MYTCKFSFSFFFFHPHIPCSPPILIFFSFFRLAGEGIVARSSWWKVDCSHPTPCHYHVGQTSPIFFFTSTSISTFTFHIHFHFPHPFSLSISTFTFHVHFNFPYTHSLLLSIPTFTFHTHIHFPYPLSLFIPTFTLKLTLHNLFLRLVEGKKLVSNLIPLSRWPNIPANKIYGKSPANICLKKKQYMSCFVLPQLH